MTAVHPPELSPDRPSTDPAHDLFGHAPFARTLAKAIRGYRGSDGIVLGLYGPWGSGKSTVLAYVEHELERGTEHERPVVVNFNPWWFSGHENLAKAFLGQLQAVLPAKYTRFKSLGDKLAEFGGALGGAADWAGAALGIPLGGKAIEAGVKLLANKPKDVPALKKAISHVLSEEKKRVLVVIDDIDRLTPDEVRQLFTVIKALADFPYITYLLAFDREVAAAAIGGQTGLPGDRYLEKIIQVPFELPRVDHSTLIQALFMRLNAVMVPTPAGRFDSYYWTNVFHSGLDRLFSVPRDIVRLTNALGVTYPAVVGEVNPVDFIAIECLRVFLPALYDVIRSTPDMFCGYQAADAHGSKERAKAFHDDWLQKLPESMRASTRELIQRLFPRLESVWSNMHYGGDSLQRWRADLRVCAPEIFPAYFRLSLPAGAVSRADVDELLASANDPAAFSDVLRRALKQKTATGTSKARALLERVMDHIADEFKPVHAVPIIGALFDMGDELLVPSDRIPGEFDFGNETRVARVVYHLLKKVERADRSQLLSSALSTGRALRCSQRLLLSLESEVEKENKGEAVTALVPEVDLNNVNSAWMKRIEFLAQDPNFAEHPSLPFLLSSWRHWGGESEAKAWWTIASKTDEGLVKLISAFQSETTSHGFGDHAVRIKVRVNPKGIEPYGDIYSMATRLQAAVDANKVPEANGPAIRRFIVECNRMKAGKNPDSFDFDDEDEA